MWSRTPSSRASPSPRPEWSLRWPAPLTPRQAPGHAPLHPGGLDDPAVPADTATPPALVVRRPAVPRRSAVPAAVRLGGAGLSGPPVGLRRVAQHIHGEP